MIFCTHLSICICIEHVCSRTSCMVAEHHLQRASDKRLFFFQPLELGHAYSAQAFLEYIAGKRIKTTSICNMSLAYIIYVYHMPSDLGERFKLACMSYCYILSVQVQILRGRVYGAGTARFVRIRMVLYGLVLWCTVGYGFVRLCMALHGYGFVRFG